MSVIGVSQDPAGATRGFVEQTGASFEVMVDEGWRLSRAFDPEFVPTLFLLDGAGSIAGVLVGFDTEGLNAVADVMGSPPIAGLDDGNPERMPGCMSRHLGPPTLEHC